MGWSGYLFHSEMSGVFPFFPGGVNTYVVKSHCDFAYCPNLSILGHSNHEAKQLQCSAVCSLSVPWPFVLTVQAYSTSFRQPNSCQKQVDHF